MPQKIPATMTTQHPDHTGVPPWKTNGAAFVSAQEEVEECISAFRLLNIWGEKGYRLARAYIGILTLEDLSTALGFKHPPVFEVILPMTDDAEKLLHLQKTFSQVAALKYQAFGDKEQRFSYLRVIPLIEGGSHLTASWKILTEYLALHRREYGQAPEYLRPFVVARSDPSLNKENLQFLAKHHAAWVPIQEDVRLIEAHLGEELGPRQAEHFLHRNLVSSAYLLWRDGKEFGEYILESAKIRRSLG
jgi:phosphoenolpyruvate carboxylase